MTLRNPAVLAKAAVTLDHVSNGRRSSRSERAARRATPSSPGSRHCPSRSSSERVLELLDDDSFQPRPVQERIPLTIGGHADEVLRLTARHADRWSSCGGEGLEPEEALRRGRERNDRLTRLCEEQGRDPAALTRSILLGYPFVRETPWRSEEAFARSRRALVAGGLRRADRLLPARDRDARGQREAGRLRAGTRARFERCSRRRVERTRMAKRRKRRTLRPRTPSRVKRRKRKRAATSTRSSSGSGSSPRASSSRPSSTSAGTAARSAAGSRTAFGRSSARPRTRCRSARSRSAG